VREGRSVLRHGAQDRFLVLLDRLALEVDAAPHVGLGKSREVRIQTGPVQPFHLPLDRRGVGVFSLWVHFRLGIKV
jgi:hypothetical protein